MKLVFIIVCAAGIAAGAVAPNDYDGDGGSDLAIFDELSGSWYVRSLAGSNIAWATPWGWPGVRPVPGDYDGDGRSDLAVFDSDSGAWYIQSLASAIGETSQGGQTVSGSLIAWNQPWGWSGAVPVPGDYNGDGRSDLAVFDLMTGNWYVRSLAGSNIAWAAPWGWSGAVPVPGDYDGDGISDLAVWDQASGIWYIRTVSGAILAWNQPWGWPGAVPVPGDYNGDGRADLAVFDNSSGAWYIQTVSGSLIAWNQPWGWPGAVPVPGDYDGDDVSDLAVWDQASGIWYIRTVSGTILAWNQMWGWRGAWPVGDGRPGWGDTIYVSPSGSDANAGASPQTPLRSIQTALGRAKPGDIVAMLPGEYSEEVRLEGAGGSAGNPVYLRATGGSARLTGNRSLSGGLTLEGCRHISIDGIEVADFADFGIQLAACDAITVRSCDVHHNGLRITQESEGGYGLYVNGSGHAILNSTITYNGANPDVGDGIIGWGTTNTVVRGNTCSYNMGNGILVEDSVGVLVEWNTVSYNEGLSTDGTWWNAGLWLDGGHHVTVRNNSFTHNVGPGIEISDEEAQAPYAYEVSGNDVSYNEWGVYLWGFRYRAVEPIVIRNNTLTGNSLAPLRIEALAATPEELNIHIE